MLGGNQNWHGQFGIKKNIFCARNQNYDASAVKPVASSIYPLYYLSSV